MSESAGPAAHTHTPVPPEGAEWLASASRFPRSVHALWALRPAAPSVLPCGSAFDVVSLPAHRGRPLLDRLWSRGRGSGPVAVHRGRLLLFATAGTADRLPALLGWEEWRNDGPGDAFPPVLCHGLGDTVTVPAVYAAASGHASSRWLAAPAARHPWLPGPELLLWAWVRTVRSSRAGRGGQGGPGGEKTNFRYAGS